MTTNFTNTFAASAATTTEALRQRLSGDVILPADAGYDEARKVANFLFDRRPAAIVRVTNAQDVAETIRYARSNGVPFAIRGGGHSVAGFSNIEDAVIIDMSRMAGVSIDPIGRLARVQPGCKSGDLAAPAHAYGLALSTGDTSSVGIGGLTTGGGIGWMVRKHGLAIDNLVSAEVVTAEGEILRASANEHADLFWAIRGGGSNFGVITEFEFKLAKVGAVYGGALAIKATKESLRAYLDYCETAPDDLTVITNLMQAPPAPFIPEDRIGELILMVLIVWTGDMAEGERAVQPLRDLGEVVADVVGPMPYPVIYDFTAAAAEPHFGIVRSMFSNELSDETLEASIDAMQAASSPMNLVQFRVLGGAMSRVSPSATAFGHRNAKYLVLAVGMWSEGAEQRGTHQAWTENLWNAIRPDANGVYSNFVAEEGNERVRDAYPNETYARLAVVKAKYDPENVFTFNQNIPPAAHAVEKAA